jgi:phage tail-like protein
MKATAPVPLVAYNFRVVVDNAAMSFSEVSGIEVAYEHVIYRHGLSFWEGEDIVTFPVNAYSPITLKRGVFLEGSPLFLYEWLKERVFKRLTVQLCDSNGHAQLLWRVAQAVPVKLSAPTFDANANNVAIDVLEVMAKGVSLDRA